MTCNDCKNHYGFWKKIGRCQRCITQLIILSMSSWILWWLLFRNDLRSIESITLIMTGVVLNGLLLLHLWMRFVVQPWKQSKHREK
ncbi:DUF3624 domain-containing protein [Vibrio ostreicida]|uniref:DUF3624 domain-containing protein n=1 Tax=Vibrio ostreicida TaxID=526588 RepID=UPI003B58EFA7